LGECVGVVTIGDRCLGTVG